MSGVLQHLAIWPYADDLAYWLAFGAALTLVFTVLLRHRQLLLLLIAMGLLIGAVPAGYMTELSVGGCCGAPSTRFKGIGYALIVVMLVAGATLLVVGYRRSRR